MKKRRPRIPAKQRLRKQVGVLFTDEQFILVDRAARLLNTDKGSRLRELALKDAERTIKKSGK